VYSPKIRDDQIHQLYLIARLRKCPMTKLLQLIVDEYLKTCEEEVRGVEVSIVQTIQIRRIV
jgi:hypothetical protein